MALTIRGTEQLMRTGATSPLFTIPGLSYLGIRRRKSPTNGETFYCLFESAASNDPSIASPAEAAYNLVSGDFEAEVEAIGPRHRLTVTAPDDPSGGTTGGVISTTYELLGNSLQKDVREHPFALALGHAVVRDIDIKLRDENADVTIPAGDATTLYNLLQQRNGNMAYQKSQYVFRFTRLASNRATINVGYANVEKIYTTAQMTNETGPPVGILAAIAEAASNSAPTPTSGYQFGWLKQTPTVTTMANNKIQITGEFWLEEWSTVLYATA